MTRLYNYLNEAISHKSLKEKEALKLLESKCKANRKYKTIFRGDGDFNYDEDGPFFFHFPAGSRAERKSANTSNHYTLLIDKFLDCWKGWPKRGKGIICSSAYNRANGYANGWNDVLIMVPEDNTPIAVCPEEDIFDSFKRVGDLGFEYMSHFNDMLGDIGIDDTESNIRKNLNMSMKKFYDLVKYNAEYDSGLWTLEKKLKKDMNKYSILKEWLEYVLDPKANGFKLVTSNKSFPTNREVWFDGSAMGYFEVHSRVGTYNKSIQG